MSANIVINHILPKLDSLYYILSHTVWA